jgi:uncharacterized phage protein (TIGR02216 family)
MSVWAEPLRLAVRLGIAPEAFWRLSLVEWRALTETPTAPVLTRAGLTALAARYPDEEIP